MFPYTALGERVASPGPFIYYDLWKPQPTGHVPLSPKTFPYIWPAYISSTIQLKNSWVVFFYFKLRETQTCDKMSVGRLEAFIHTVTLTRLRGAFANVPQISEKTWPVRWTGDTGTPHGRESHKGGQCLAMSPTKFHTGGTPCSGDRRVSGSGPHSSSLQDLLQTLKGHCTTRILHVV